MIYISVKASLSKYSLEYTYIADLKFLNCKSFIFGIFRIGEVKRRPHLNCMDQGSAFI